MAIAELVMPKMGESIMEATILRWHKKVGDHIQQDETILDIATDKVDSEVPSSVSGIITEILYNVNDVVPVGAVLVKIETDSPAAVAPSPVTAPAQPQTEYTPPPPSPVQQAYISPPVTQPIPYIPQPAGNKPVIGNNKFFSPLVLNIANSEGLSLSELERIPGTGADGRVSKRDVLQYIADKKAGRVPTFIARQPAYYTQQAAPQPVIRQFSEQEIAAPQQPVTPSQPEPVYIPPTVMPTSQPAEQQPIVYAVPEQPQQPVTVPQPVPIYVPPVVPQPITQQTQQPVPVEFQQPQPVYITSQPSPQAAVAQPVVQHTPEQTPVTETAKPNVEIIEMDRMRKLIAKHMVDSKHTSAHVTSFAEADVTNMVLWRSKIKDDFEKVEGTKITFTPMFIECLVKVMKRFPIINSSVEGEKIIIKNYLNIGMATALPNGNLIVPVIKNAENMSLVSLTRAVNSLADNARKNKLKPDDTQGGTFTLTNVGTFGSLMGTPIINQPQVAIMAVGAIKKRPVVIETDKGDFIGIRHMMYLSMSYDHRIIDGSIGAGFLSEVAKEFEKWDVNRELKLIVKEQYID